MAERKRTEPFSKPGTKKAYAKFGAYWFPSEQVIYVAEEINATAFRLGTSILILSGRKGRGAVAAMHEHYVAECGGDKGIRAVKWADFR